MEQVVPWKELNALVEPFYPKAGKGRPPVGLERMLRIHFLQSWFNLSDPAAEEALYDIESMRRFVGIDVGNEPVPDETTICKFRHLLETHGLGERIFQEVDAHLEEKGLRLSEGTIMDVTIINAPSSTKNREKKRDPDMHSTKKGNQYSIGMKIHVGPDRESKTAHSLVTTPANVHDSRMVERLLHGRENAVFGDSAYMGKTEEIREKAPKGVGPDPDARNEKQKAHRGRQGSEPSAFENEKPCRTHLSDGEEGIRFTKVQYKGLPRNANFIFVLFALSNLYMVRRDLSEPTGA